ncbi:hypothetical protein THOM_1227 [Trachipleistophora hominis]|uniref:Uncharacterized protein n=1 Tax=Trachipleistophora hominis TaxID=72359 RepID=L7JWL4_TRAHO|nr:hypothetical protein THOM_1227 [Trachipleistophora hominis]
MTRHFNFTKRICNQSRSQKIHPGLESILANANKPIILRDYQEDAAEAVLSKLPTVCENLLW